MNIRKIKINGFGKLEKKEIQFDKRINVIYGKNEAGKSTLLKFMSSCLYGISKNKNGETISDYEKYRPWHNYDYSGKIEYQMDDRHIYDVYRDFNKKNPSIYDDNGEDISNSFTKNKTNGIDFFAEQTGIEKELYLNTAIIQQEKIRLKSNIQNDVINRISNLVNTGDDVISYKETINKIKSEQLELIGSDRTTQKPINRLNSKIDYLLKEKQKLEKYKNSFISSETKLNELEIQYEKEKRKYFLLKLEKENFDKNQKIESELELLNQNKNEIENNIKALNKKEHESSNNKKGSKLKIFDIVLSIILVIAMILIWIFSDNRVMNFAFSAISGLIILVIIIKDINSYIKTEKQIKEVNIYNTNLMTEQNFLKENLDNIVQKFNIKAEEYDCQLEEQFNKLKELCQSREELEYVKKIHDFSLEEIIDELENKSSEIYEMDVSIRLLNQDMENSNQKIEQLLQLEEELYNLQEEKRELKELNNIYELTKECIEEAYEDTKRNLSPLYKENMSNILMKMSNNKYSRVEINDETILVENENGELVPISLLSTGTIDQIYLALRLSVINEVTEENLPIFFDETFSYFDDERLENFIKYTYFNYKDKQIFIFTCSKRECSILDKLQIDYNFVNIG